MKTNFTRVVFVFLCSIVLESAFTQITYVDLSIDQPNVEDCVTGIETNFDPESMNVFPNPTKGLFTIHLDKTGLTDEFVLDVHNTNGQVIYTEKIKVVNEKPEKQIDLSGYPSGTYLLSISSKEKYFKAQIILK